MANPYAIRDDAEVFDVEIYKNYLLILFRNMKTRKVTFFEVIPGETLDRERLRKKMRSCQTIGFNSRNFDLPIVYGAIAGLSIKTLKAITDDIIVGGMKPWDVERAYGFEIPRNLNTIDLMEVAPGQGSLKIYNGRLHGKRMQDLPTEPNAVLTPAEMDETFEYCHNDLDATELLFNSLREQLELRASMSAEYGEDLRSKSDAQVAEAVIKSQVTKLMGTKPEKPTGVPGTGYFYDVPDFIKFRHPELRAILRAIEDSTFRLSAAGKLELPKALANAEIRIGKGVYRMGIGGLHSSETTIAQYADEEHSLFDRDVTSYYPRIIINQKLAPKALGWAFRKVYKSIVERRVKAKAEGNKVEADSLKITANGSFGKFGSRFSALFSPQLLIQTTITGQLALLMLIEWLEEEGIPIVNANTDGIVMRCPKRKHNVMLNVIAEWEAATNFQTEETEYAALYSRDVNNYIAVKPDGKVKTKGAYAPTGFQKNPTTTICVDAVIAYLTKGTPLRETILGCEDITKFVSVRTVQGGAMWGKKYLGKAIRWYYSMSESHPIVYKNANSTGHHNKVPRSDGAKPLMTLPDAIPDDLDYMWYVREARDILVQIGRHEEVIKCSKPKSKKKLEPSH